MNLVEDLHYLPGGSEVVFVAAGQSRPKCWPTRGDLDHLELQWLSSDQLRARQMNYGAIRSNGQFLWFLHCDSRLSRSAIDRLTRRLKNNPAPLLFFDLRFLPDATPITSLNSLGARVRSRVFGLPFGDQGFCVERVLYEQLQGFPEVLGEDHHFVWRARRVGVWPTPVGEVIHTSARKYREQGWLRTTVKHVRLTISQAYSEITGNPPSPLARDSSDDG